MSPSKHIRSKNPAVSGGGGGAVTTDVPSARWSDDATADDTLALCRVALAEDATVDDIFALLYITNPENATAGDVHWRASAVDITMILLKLSASTPSSSRR